MTVTPQPGWARKHLEGKMFQRLECSRCHFSFHFSEPPRATRVPRCPSCGAFGGYPAE